jgi:hypothetical protein
MKGSRPPYFQDIRKKKLDSRLAARYPWTSEYMGMDPWPGQESFSNRIHRLGTNLSPKAKADALRRRP